jgi:DNA polymerase (family 10)
MEEMALAARERGLEYICFCDHSQSIGMGIGLTPQQVLEQIREVRELDARLEGISLLAGSEVDILADGRIDLPDEILRQLDFVTASIHSGFKQSPAQIMQRLISALENPWVDAIGHPTGRLLGRREPYEIDIDLLARRAFETGTFLELNASYDRLDLRAGHARRAKELGARLVISSDAHSPHGFDLLPYGIGEARRGWLEPADVANTRPFSEFRALLRRNAA